MTMLNPEHQKALEKHYKSIVQTIDAGQLAPILLQEGIISADGLERIQKSGITLRDKAEELMRTIFRCDNPLVFDIFLQALRDERYEWLADNIVDKVSGERRANRRLKREAPVDEQLKIIDSEQPQSPSKTRHNSTGEGGRLSHGESFEAGKKRSQVNTQVKKLSNCLQNGIPEDTGSCNNILVYNNSSRFFPAAETPFGGSNENRSKETEVKCVFSESMLFSDETILKTVAEPEFSCLQIENVNGDSYDMVDGVIREESCNNCDKVDGVALDEDDPSKKLQILRSTALDKINNSVNTDRLNSKIGRRVCCVRSEEINNLDRMLKLNINGQNRGATSDIRDNRSHPYSELNIRSSESPDSNVSNALHLNRHTITLTRNRLDESFGFKFVPATAGGRGRFDDDRDYFVTKIINGSIAAKESQLRVFDTIISINDKIIKEMEYDDVVELISEEMEIEMVICHFEGNK